MLEKTKEVFDETLSAMLDTSKEIFIDEDGVFHEDEYIAFVYDEYNIKL